MLISSYFPPTLRSNDELQSGRWSSAKILEKTGIISRCVAVEETALDLAYHAAKNLMDESNIAISEVSSLIYCTQSPDYIIPNNVSILHNRLGINVSSPTIEYNQGCSGYLYGLFIAKSLLLSGQVENVLLVTADTYTKYLQPSNQSCRTIFGDAATASLISKNDAEGFGHFSFGTDGSGYEALYLKGEGSRMRDQPLDLYMNGPDIFSFALDVVPSVVADTLLKNGLTVDDIDYFIFHQANGFMLEALRQKMDIPEEKFCLHFSEYGNTVSSTIPIVMEHMKNTGLLTLGKKVLLCGFGVGLSWGATVLIV